MSFGIVVIKNQEVLAIPNLLRYVLKSIYDKKNMTNEETHRMQESIIIWSEAIKFQREKLAHINGGELKTFGRVLTTDHKYSEEEFQLRNIAGMIEDDNNGRLDKRKETFAIHGIDYRKFYRLPEAYEKEDFLKGQAALEESKKAYPEEYKK